MSKPPKASGKWYRVENATATEADLYIYGAIGDFWGEDDVTAGSFVQSLKEITASTINLHINSPGGLVFDAVAIYSALKNHEATVNVTVDGVAASAASFVAMAGDSIAIEKPAQMMIHDAHGLVVGNADFMREMADLYDQFSDTIADIYAMKTGKPKDEWRTAMKAETWYTSEGAVEAGLADRILNDKQESTAENISRSQLIKARARALQLGGR
jgi:ATP-dependent protease ClpP protease subunit